MWECMSNCACESVCAYYRLYEEEEDGDGEERRGEHWCRKGREGGQ